MKAVDCSPDRTVILPQSANQDWLQLWSVSCSVKQCEDKKAHCLRVDRYNSVRFKVNNIQWKGTVGILGCELSVASMITGWTPSADEDYGKAPEKFLKWSWWWGCFLSCCVLSIWGSCWIFQWIFVKTKLDRHFDSELWNVSSTVRKIVLASIRGINSKATMRQMKTHEQQDVNSITSGGAFFFFLQNENLLWIITVLWSCVLWRGFQTLQTRSCQEVSR